MSKRKVGIVGYGSLGQFLAHKILEDQKILAELEIAFIWNRSVDKIASDSKIDKKLILEDLSQFPSRGAGMKTILLFDP
jgi:aspartate dehydrogenase